MVPEPEELLEKYSVFASGLRNSNSVRRAKNLFFDKPSMYFCHSRLTQKDGVSELKLSINLPQSLINRKTRIVEWHLPHYGTHSKHTNCLNFLAQ